tara:strand:+ start:18823 stop:19074 length:252 start_codon:yes stop_codon:yes gene_type:complete
MYSAKNRAAWRRVGIVGCSASAVETCGTRRARGTNANNFAADNFGGGAHGINRLFTPVAQQLLKTGSRHRAGSVAALCTSRKV